MRFKDYRYLYNEVPQISKFWEPIILNMLMELDKAIRPKTIPRFAANKLFDVANSKNFNAYGAYYLASILNGFSLDVIKTRFANLIIDGNFTNYKSIIDKAIATCNSTCENCGKPASQKVMIRSWVTNLCSDCITIKK